MPHSKPISLKDVFQLWLPLAGSWLLMGIESPMLAAFVARMVSPEITLATWGSLVYPISLVVEGPIIMLLTASTALAKDLFAYQKLFKYMIFMSLTLSLIHILIAFTPLFFFVAEDLMNVPKSLLLPGKIGLQIMTPWTLMIAWRRLNQGVMIRHGSSNLVAIGTFIRLASLVLVLSYGRWFTSFSGIIVGASAVAIAVTAEAIYAQVAVRRILKEMSHQSIESNQITRKSFMKFYLPLAITPLASLLIHPVGAAGMSRMPEALPSLAAWPVVYGLVFITRSLGFAFNEVVVALLPRPNGKLELLRFTRILAISTSAFLALLALTPLGSFWFLYVSGLSEELAYLSSVTLIFAVLMPGYQAYQAWYSGLLINENKTSGISYAVLVYAIIAIIGLWIGAHRATFPGIYWAVNVFVFAGLSQTLYLRHSYKKIG
jgi:hypothetical protein